MKKLFILILFFTHSICFSQDFWVRCPDIMGFNDLVFDNENCAYLSSGNSVYKRPEGEKEWELIAKCYHKDGVGIDNKNILYNINRDYVYISKDKGVTWDTINNYGYGFQDLLVSDEGRVWLTWIGWADMSFKIGEIDMDSMKLKILQRTINYGSPHNFYTAVSNRNRTGLLIVDLSSLILANLWIMNDRGVEAYKCTNPPRLDYIALLNDRVFTFSELGYIYLSTDYGTTWTDLKTELPVKEDMFHITGAERFGKNIFIATEYGIYKYNEISNSFIDFNFNLPSQRVAGIAMDRKGYMYLSAYSGTYKSVSSLTDVIETQEKPVRDYIYPNPASINCSLFLSGLSIGSGFNVKVYNSLGIEVLDLGNYIADNHEMKLDINTESFSPGAYFACFEQNGMRHTIPFTVNK